MDADLQFRRGLEELVRGHFDGCAASISSSCADSSAASEEDLAESSRRHESHILSRLVAREADEIFNNIERESEILALSGLHSVSTFDSSLLRETRRSNSGSNTNASSTPVGRDAGSPAVSYRSQAFQIWRELEDVSVAMERERRLQGRRERSRGGSEVLRSRPSLVSPGGSEVSRSRPSREFSTEIRQEVLEREREREMEREREREWERERESERVRRIISQLFTETEPRTRSRAPPSREDNSRTEQVRMVREWIQERDPARASRREEREWERERGRERSAGAVVEQENGQRRQMLRIRGRQARSDLISRMARERQRELHSLSEHQAVTRFSHRTRIQALLRGRFLRNIPAVEEERPVSVAAREIGQLRQRQRVSGLSLSTHYRLEDAVSYDLESYISDTTSIGHSELSSDVQSQATIEMLDSQETNITTTAAPVTSTTTTTTAQQASTPNQDTLETAPSNIVQISPPPIPEITALENVTATEDPLQPSPENEFNQRHEEGGEANITESRNEGDQLRTMTDMESPEQDWQDDESHTSDDNWQDEFSPPMIDMPEFAQRTNEFVPSDDDNVYSMELRELLSRRSVSNLLHSGFRENLDRLIRSYVQRQGRGPLDWNLDGSAGNLPEGTQNRQRDNGNQELRDRPTLGIPPPPLPPRQRLFHSALRHSNLTRHNVHRHEFEWEAINDIRNDMGRLQQSMNQMQRMLESCMDMQLELQRSVRQEVSAALNRFEGSSGKNIDLADDGTKWSQVKKGTCCVCCDTQIDSLLYRVQG
ncbi:uncharacterized protein LOC144576203 isoform X3 [Carex rostrata]